jgi:O-antigen/teichoic acid export membrane protein
MKTEESSKESLIPSPQDVSSLQKFYPRLQETIRGKKRRNKILLTSFGLSISKILSIIISFALVSLMLKYLGQEKFGLWMIISSTITMLSFADMGVGSGVQNAVSIADGKNDIDVIREKISNSIVVLTIIAIVLVCVYFLCFPMLPWQEFLGVDSRNENEIFNAISIVVLMFAFSMPCSVGLKVLNGLQRGLEVSVWHSLIHVLTFIFVIFAIYFKGDFTHFAFLYFLPTLLIPLIASLVLFIKEKKIRPQIKLVNINKIKNIGNISFLFFVLQLSGLIAFYSDTLIVTAYLGVSSVAVYSVSSKLFALPSVLLSLFLVPLWPAYAEANSRGDMVWVFESFLKSIKYSVIIVVPLSIIMLFFGNFVIEKWVGQAIQVPFSLWLSLFFLSILTIFGGNFSSLLNGLNIIKFQVITSLAMAVSNIIISVILVQKIGVSGVVWGSVISLILFVYFPTSIFIWKFFK